MQMMAVEMMMMMIMKVMCVCYDDDGAQEHGLGKINTGTTFTSTLIMHAWKKNWFAYLRRTGRPAGPQEKKQKKTQQNIKIIIAIIVWQFHVNTCQTENSLF